MSTLQWIRSPSVARPRTLLASRVIGIGALGAVAAAALWLAWVAVPEWFGDADWYAAALPAVQGDAPLYDPLTLVPHVAARPVHFNLPPAMALLSPIAGMGRLPWGLLMLACLLAGLALVWPRLRQPWDLLMAGVVVTSLPFLSAVVFANVNSLIVLLLAVGVRWPRVAGTALGIAAALKVAPIFAFAWLIARRDWRGVLTGLAVAAGLTVGAALVVDPNALVDFVVVRLNELPRPGPLATGLTSFGVPALVVLRVGVRHRRGGRRAPQPPVRDPRLPGGGPGPPRALLDVAAGRDLRARHPTVAGGL